VKLLDVLCNLLIVPFYAGLILLAWSLFGGPPEYAWPALLLSSGSLGLFLSLQAIVNIMADAKERAARARERKGRQP
jgi:hypothetical protein